MSAYPAEPGDHGRCRSCGADVIWAKTAAGKLMPLDATETLGKVVYQLDTTGRMQRAEGRGHESHFATCPQADRWRRG